MPIDPGRTARVWVLGLGLRANERRHRGKTPYAKPPFPSVSPWLPAEPAHGEGRGRLLPAGGARGHFALPAAWDFKRTYWLPKRHFITTPGLVPSLLLPQKVLLIAVAQIWFFDVFTGGGWWKTRSLGLSSWSSDSATDAPSYLALVIQVNGIKKTSQGSSYSYSEGRRWVSCHQSLFGIVPGCRLITLAIPGTNKVDSSVPPIFRNISWKKVLICFPGSP